MLIIIVSYLSWRLGDPSGRSSASVVAGFVPLVFAAQLGRVLCDSCVGVNASVCWLSQVGEYALISSVLVDFLCRRSAVDMGVRLRGCMLFVRSTSGRGFIVVHNSSPWLLSSGVVWNGSELPTKSRDSVWRVHLFRRWAWGLSGRDVNMPPPSGRAQREKLSFQFRVSVSRSRVDVSKSSWKIRVVEFPGAVQVVARVCRWHSNS